LRLAAPRVTRGLVALARARPTAISSTAPRSRNLPLGGRGIDRSAVAASTAPRSRIRPLRGRGFDRPAVAALPPHSRGIDHSTVADSTAPRSRTLYRARERNPWRQEPTTSGADVVRSLSCQLLPLIKGGAATPHWKLFIQSLRRCPSAVRWSSVSLPCSRAMSNTLRPIQPGRSSPRMEGGALHG